MVRVEPRIRVFQSTRPVWGATQRSGYRRGISKVSIHAPRVGRDRVLVKHCPVQDKRWFARRGAILMSENHRHISEVCIYFYEKGL